MRIEVENFFWSRGIDDLPFNRTPQWLPIGEHWLLLRLCALAVQLASDVCCYNSAHEIGQYYDHATKNEQWEHEGTAEIAEFSTGLQTRQEERFVILLFLLFWGEEVRKEFFKTFALVIHPLTVKNRPCALIRSCALNRKNTVLYLKICTHLVQISKWSVCLLNKVAIQLIVDLWIPPNLKPDYSQFLMEMHLAQTCTCE